MVTDLIKLKSFVHAAEALNFSNAADHMHLTQPTISHHIKTLERGLGVELFVRSGSNLQLTEAGRLLLPRAHEIIHQAIEIQEMLASLQEEIAGDLRLACSTTAGKYILPLLAARFCRRYHGIRVSILTCTPEHVVPRLLKGEANLGIVSSYDICRNGLECQAFFNDSITLIVAHGHPWALRGCIEPGDLLEEPMIVREPTSGTRRVMLTELAKHDITLDDLNVFLELGNAEAIVRTVAAGFGVSFVSTLATDCAVERGYVVEVAVAGLELKRKIYMVRCSLDEPSRPQEVFWSFVHDPANADLLRLAGP
jgi:DNA-binding transcriptional LysR family regulator